MSVKESKRGGGREREREREVCAPVSHVEYRGGVGFIVEVIWNTSNVGVDGGTHEGLKNEVADAGVDVAYAWQQLLHGVDEVELVQPEKLQDVYEVQPGEDAKKECLLVAYKGHWS